MKQWVTILGLIALSLNTANCSANVSGAEERPTLRFEFSIENGPFVQNENLAYYFVVNTNNPTTTPNEMAPPRINGGMPITFPFPDPRAFLPFTRSSNSRGAGTGGRSLDWTTIDVRDSDYTTYFTLTTVDGELKVFKGTTNGVGAAPFDRVRELAQGREWQIVDNKTLRLTIPFEQLTPEPTTPEITANLAVATRGLGAPPPLPPGFIPNTTGPANLGQVQRSVILDRWQQVQDSFFSIQTKPIRQQGFDSVPQILNPQYLALIPGASAPQVNLVSYTYQVILGEQ
jgi:hypothetical protein